MHESDKAGFIMKAINFVKRQLNKYRYSSYQYQLQHWKEYLVDFNNTQRTSEVSFGFEWGDPEDENDRHGNYRKVLDLLKSNFDQNDVVLEVGVLGGKWTKYMLDAKKVIAVDINAEFTGYLRKKFPDASNMDFYVSQGYELAGIKDESVNLVFCMDTFTRVRKKWILNYFKEFERILVKGGAVVVHVPNDDLPVSRGRGFTSLDSCEIAKLCTKHFTEFVIDSMTLKHGSVIYAKK